MSNPSMNLDSESPGDKPIIDSEALQKAAMILRALNHELRQQIIQLLCDEGSLNVTDIFVNLRVEQSVASQHLAILRKADIVVRERKGKFIHYNVDHERLHRIKDLVSHLAD